MKNNPHYQQLRQKALDDNYTIEQVENLTSSQLSQALNIEEAEIGPHLNGMKELLTAEMKTAADKTRTDSIIAAFKTWLDTNFPQHEEIVDTEDGKVFVAIWLEGKP